MAGQGGSIKRNVIIGVGGSLLLLALLLLIRGCL